MSADRRRRGAEATGPGPAERLRFMQAALGSSAEGIHVVDAGGNLVHVNRACERLLQRAPTEARPFWEQLSGLELRFPDGRLVPQDQMRGVVSGFPRSETIHEDGSPFPPEMHPSLVALRTGKRVTDVVVGLVRSDEEPCWLLLQAVPIRDPESGEIRGSVATFADITDRKRAEDKLQQVCSELQSVFQALPDLLFRLDADGTILDYKAGRPSDLYVPPQVFLGRRMQEVLPPDVGARFQEAIERVLETRSQVALDYSLSLPRGEQTFEARVLALPGREVVAVVRNITERRQAEEARERLFREIDAQYRRFLSFFENVPVGIAALRPPDFVYEYANPAYQAFAPGRSILGKPLAEVSPILAPQVLPILERTVSTGQPHSVADLPLAIQRAPGAPAEQTCFTFATGPTRDDSGKPTAVWVLAVETAEQVKARKRIEELADAAQRRAAELQTILANVVDSV